MSNVYAILSGRLANSSGLALLVSEWEARSMAMYSQKEMQSVLKSNRRSEEWFEGLLIPSCDTRRRGSNSQTTL